MADTLVVRLSEDAFNGDAQFTLDLDGTQIAGPTSVTTAHSSGGFQDFTYTGDFGAGPHTVAVHFLNDAWGGSADTDRNLYVGGITFDGTNYAGETAQNTAMNGQPDADPNAAEMYVNGAVTFTNVSGSSSPPPPPPPSGLVLHVSEDAWNGDAQFVVRVDGTQIGGTLTTTASHSLGQVQDIPIDGSFGTGPHTVEIQFLNDAYGGTPDTDRNLYVEGITFNGVNYPGEGQPNTGAGADTDPNAAEVMSNGTVTFSNVGGSSPPPPPPGGPDTLVLHLSEDAWNGDAQFAVLVDGTRIGGPLSVTTAHSTGTFQDFTFNGDFGAGPHTVEVDFLNDAWGGTPDTDRNLYVGGITFNGVNYPGEGQPNTGAGPDTDPNAAEVFSNGAVTFANVGGSSPPPPPPPSGTTSTIVLHVAEDAWNGDAQFLVLVDGVQQGAARTVTASHSAGQVQDFTITGDYGALGPTTVAVEFINDAYGGSAGTDRNLYVEGIDVNGNHFAGSTAADDAANGHEADDPSAAVMDVNGTATFTLIVYGDTSGDLGDNTHAGAQSLNGSNIVIGDAHAFFGSAVGGDDTISMAGINHDITAIGDAQTITDSAIGGNDTITANANLFAANAYGDALTLSGNAHGGDDHISASGRFMATAYGDAQTISDHAQGGNDTITLDGNRFGSTAYGDAETITDNGRGGNDIITASGADTSGSTLLYGDAKTLSGFAVGGNDTITGAQFADQMYGDGGSLLDSATGGNDTLISGPANDQMWGDAATVAAGAQTGADLFVFNRTSATNLGNDTIEDFQPSKDHIQLQNYSGVSSFNDLSSHISDTSDGSLITFDSQNTILVMNDHQLTASDFLFG
jgi:hypothetical protein